MRHKPAQAVEVGASSVQSCLVCHQPVLHDCLSFQTRGGETRFVWKGRAHGLPVRSCPGQASQCVCEGGIRA